MLLPTLTTGASSLDGSAWTRLARLPSTEVDTIMGGGIMPLQQADICHTATGPCTHQWPWYAGKQCVTGASGVQQCCSGAFQFPYLRECQNPDGSWRAEERGCAFCI
jgi:hypothetical protein